MSKDEQEYYHSSVGYCMIWGDVVDKPEMVIVSENSDYGSITVVKRSELVKKEDTWEYKQAQKRKEEIEAITKKAEDNLNAIASKVVDRALRSLASRMKFNVAFSSDLGNAAGWAITISNELEKMIKEKAKDEMKDFQL